MEMISKGKLVWDHLVQCCSLLRWIETQNFSGEEDLKGNLVQVTRVAQIIAVYNLLDILSCPQCFAKTTLV